MKTLALVLLTLSLVACSSKEQPKAAEAPAAQPVLQPSPVQPPPPEIIKEEPKKEKEAPKKSEKKKDKKA